MSCPVWVCLEQVHMHTNSHSSRKPLPSQHLLSINEGLAGGPCFGTPPKLHSFKKRPWWSQECFSFSSREDNVETYTVRCDRGLFSPLSPPFYLIFSVFRVMSSPPPPQKTRSQTLCHICRGETKKRFPDDIQLAGCPSSHLPRSFLFVWPHRGQRKRSIFIRPHFLSFSLSPSARQKASCSR